MNLYFAYGSNMNFARIQKRCSNVKYNNIAFLKDWELLFNKEKDDKTGAANIRPCKGKVVWGVLYHLTNDDQLKLDFYEGYNHLAKIHPDYIRQTINVSLPNHTNVSAYVYIADPSQRQILPSKEYLNFIVTGAAEHNLPPEYQQLLNNTEFIIK